MLLPTPKHTPVSFKDAEHLVGHALRRQGWEILSRNYRGTGFELDLVVKKCGTLAIVEVKHRPNYSLTYPQNDQLLNQRKYRSLLKGALSFITKFQISAATIRIDLAIVSNQNIIYYPNVIDNYNYPSRNSDTR